VVAMAILLGFLGASTGELAAQKGGNKEAEKFRKSSEATREELAEGKEQIQDTLNIYNSLMQGKAKKPQDAYKKLTKSVEKCDKLSASIRKKVDEMKKQANTFLTGWEKELEAYSSESFKEMSQKQLDTARARFDTMTARMGEGREAYQPFITSLKDQVQFLGRDFSPEALSALSEAAAKVNSDGEAVMALIDKILSNEAADEEEVADIEVPSEESADEMAGDETGDDDMADDTGDLSGDDSPDDMD
jgi:SMC interacting uncharacterized protein involved in chromosome segregation